MWTRTHRIVVVAVLLIFASVAGALWWQSSEVAPYMPPATEPPGHGVTGDAAASDDSYDVSVTYTDDGFDPRDLKVDKGTRVRFLNASGQSSFWPASGVHPTHTLYPEKEPADCLGSSFDACRELAPGEFYDFTFNYVGTWSFHDHLHAYHTGSITVSPPSTP